MYAQKGTRPIPTTDPAPEFELYGLAGWADTRALDEPCVVSRNGIDTTYGVWLAHLSEGSGVRVGTFRTDLTDDVARRGVHALLDFTVPVDEPSLVGLKTILGNVRPEWAEVEWTIDGARVPARVWRFAGAWVGWASAGDLGVVVLGTDEREIELERVDSRDYGFAPGAPISRELYVGHARMSMHTKLALPNKKWHADQLELLSTFSPE